MHNLLARNITFAGTLRFTGPTILMMLFMSIYTMVDGIFVSRFVGTGALSAVNIVYPVINIVIAIAIMLSTGGSAVIAKQMGEGKPLLARRNFSMIVYIGIMIGITIMILGLFFIDPILRFLGANDAVYSYCYDYAFLLILFVPCGIMQMLFQSFFITAGKPTVGMIATFAGGIANILLDYLFIAVFKWGISGAALATGIGYSIPGFFGLFYFIFNRKGSLFLTKTKWDGKIVSRICLNGSSEMVTNLSVAVTTFLFNIMMMRLLGENGVAAITIILYTQYLMNAVFLGYSGGVAPLFSYNYGAQGIAQLKKLLRYSLIFVGITSIAVFMISIFGAGYIVAIFAPPGSMVFDVADRGMLLFSFAFLVMGFNIFVSSLFTALNNGKISALLSFLRTFLFISAMILILPNFLGVDGIWLALPIAEGCAFVFSFVFLLKKRTQYHYC
ncbi:MAG: MATE family efflux transporter [Christensenella sp.]|nr:MATE family efflux transporter [Christensenella sp.]